MELSGATLTVSQPVDIADRWAQIVDEPIGNTGVRFSADEVERGLTEIIVKADPEQVPAASSDGPVRIGGVEFVFEPRQEEEE